MPGLTAAVYTHTSNKQLEWYTYDRYPYSNASLLKWGSKKSYQQYLASLFFHTIIAGHATCVQWLVVQSFGFFGCMQIVAQHLQSKTRQIGTYYDTQKILTV